MGDYANTNYGQTNTLADVPNSPDTLSLYGDLRFKSKYWGEGSYQITTSVSGTKIVLIYSYKFGKGEFEAPIKRLNWGNPKIIIDEDRNQYFEKVE